MMDVEATIVDHAVGETGVLDNWNDVILGKTTSGQCDIVMWRHRVGCYAFTVFRHEARPRPSTLLRNA